MCRPEYRRSRSAMSAVVRPSTASTGSTPLPTWSEPSRRPPRPGRSCRSLTLPSPRSTARERLRQIDPGASRCARTISAVCRAREKSDEKMTVSLDRSQACAASSACVAADLREPVIAAQVVLDAAHDDPGHVRLALPVPHDAVGLHEAVMPLRWLAELSASSRQASPIPARSVPLSSPHSHAMSPRPVKGRPVALAGPQAHPLRVALARGGGPHRPGGIVDLRIASGASPWSSMDPLTSRAPTGR